MTIHLSNENLEKYGRRALTPRELLAADEHLAACESCRELAAHTRAGNNAFAALRADLDAAQFDLEHIAPEQMSSFVDDALDAADRGIVESHLTVCSMCFDEVNDLRAFSAMLETERPLISPDPVSPGFRDRLRDIFSGLGRLSYPRLAATAAAGLLLFVSAAALMFYVWKSTRSGRQEVATSSPREAVPIPQPTTENGQQPLPSPVHSPSPIVVVSLDDGGQRVTLDEQGNLTGLSSLSPATQRALIEALKTGRVRTPAELDELESKSGVLMGKPSDGVAFPLIGPIGTIVRSDRPTFSWRPLAGAQLYTVTILDSGLKLIASSPSLTATRWTVPGPLKRGQIYVWQVTAIKDDKEVTSPTAPAPEAQFKVLESAKAEQLRRVEAGRPASHLARGISYVEAGLLDDAKREFRALLAANPQSDAARKLLHSVEARRRAN